MIVEADESHIAGIVELIIEYKSLKPEEADSFTPVVRSLVEEPNSMLFVYLNDADRVEGYIAYHTIWFPLVGGQEVYISDLLVDPRGRGKGIGSRLMEKCEEDVRRLGAKRILLNNGTFMDSYKRKFYSKLGYKERNNFSNFVKML